MRELKEYVMLSLLAVLALAFATTAHAQTPNTLTFTITAVGTGTGAVNANGGFAAGDAVSLSASPDPGMVFAGWFGDPACNGLATMPARRVTCVGILNNPALPSPGSNYLAAFTDNGSGCVSFPSTTPAAGMPVTISARPALGYTFSGWGVDCAGMSNPSTFTMPNRPMVCPANFAPIVGATQVPATCP